MGTAVSANVDPADLWDWLVHKGVSGTEATKHVLRVIANSPDNVRREYLKDVDPGKLASFGLGAADMMSFGLGDQLARAVDKFGGLQDAQLAQAAAHQEHPGAHFLGEIAGMLAPIGAELGLEKAQVMAPSALTKLVGGIRSTGGRAAAKTAVNAAMGAAYTGAQVAGHTEGSLGERTRAAAQAAPAGAVVGAVLPWVVGGIAAGGKRLLGPVAARVAGKAPATPATSDLADMIAENQRMNERAQQWITDRQGMTPPPTSPATNTPPITATPRLRTVQPSEPLDLPTFQRRAGAAAVPGRPDLGTLVEGSPYQTAGSPLRTASPQAPSSVVPQQMQLIVDALKGAPRAEWPKILEPFRALGMLSDAEVQQLMQMPELSARGSLPVSEYGGSHRPPRPGYGAPAHDLTQMFPEDVYGPNARQYYGEGSALDASAQEFIRGVRNNPEAPVTVYRAVPKNGPAKINAGDWVTPFRKYAVRHGESALNGAYRIVSDVVRAGDIYTSPDSWFEYGYHPSKP